LPEPPYHHLTEDNLSVPASGCVSTCASVLVLGAIELAGPMAVKVAGLETVEVVGATTGFVVVASPVVVSMTTALGIATPSACIPIKISPAFSRGYDYSSQ
jgi:hypothetical protein